MPFHLSPVTQNSASSIALVCGLGLVLGMRHSTDADHLVALSTIVSKQRSIRRAAVIGSLWGVGHTLTIFAVGSLIILFGLRIPVRLGLAMEFSVAVMLVVLGLLNLTGIMQRLSKRFVPAQRQAPHAHRHLWDEHLHEFGLFQGLRPLAIGLVHGLAGSAAVALLVLSTIRDPLWATLYLLIFGVGTIVGMVLMTAAIAVPLTYGTRRFTNLNRHLATASGFVSLCFGTFLVYQLGYVGGLFSQHPHWTPQ